MSAFDNANNNSGAELLQRCRQGDNSAANELCLRYAAKLCRLSERHLSQRLAVPIAGVCASR